MQRDPDHPAVGQLGHNLEINKTGLQPVPKTCGTNSWVLSKIFKCKKVLAFFWRENIAHLDANVQIERS